MALQHHHIVIIGAGISGTSLAWLLQQRGASYQLFEAAPRAGGYLQTLWQEGFRLEIGPNSLLADAQTMGYLRQTGLDAHINQPSAAANDRYVVRQGRLQKLPGKPQQALFGGFLSLGTKLKVLRELFNKTTSPPGETVAAFFRRHFGNEVVEAAVGPFISGIYGGDPEQLLVQAAFPQLVEMERQHGSVLKGFAKAAKGGRRQSFSFKQGMEQLVSHVAAQLNHLHLGHKLLAIDPDPAGWLLAIQQPSGEIMQVTCAQLVLALPAHACASLLKNIDAEAAGAFSLVRYAAMAAVHTGWKMEQAPTLPEGFGALHTLDNATATLGSIWSSSAYPDAAPQGHRLFTTFVGGMVKTQPYHQPDEQLLAQVVRELQKIYGLKGAPVMHRISRWPQAIPQYDAAQVQAAAYAPALAQRGIHLHSNWLGGVSLNDAIGKSFKLVETLG